jgi:hypothetical protein
MRRTEFPDPDDAADTFCGKDWAGTRQELDSAGRSFSQLAPAGLRHGGQWMQTPGDGVDDFVLRYR